MRCKESTAIKTHGLSWSTTCSKHDGEREKQANILRVLNSLFVRSFRSEEKRISIIIDALTQTDSHKYFATETQLRACVWGRMCLHLGVLLGAIYACCTCI